LTGEELKGVILGYTEKILGNSKRKHRLENKE